MSIQKKTVDFLIVGAGSAGCLLANRLSKNQNQTVALVEYGPKDDSHFIHLPVGFPFLIGLWAGKQYTYQELRTEPEKELFDRKTYQPRGRTLGGSSSLNAMIYIRGNKYDYDQWAKLLEGKGGWSYDQVLPVFKSFENNQRFKNDPFHGNQGELFVTSANFISDTSKEFIKSCQEVGIQKIEDFNGADQEGSGFYQRTIYNGKRCSSAKAFLTNEVKQRQNLSIITEQKAIEIIVDGGKNAQGVRFVNSKGEQNIVEASKEIILCSGAFGSPQLLKLSGIGETKELSEHNIKTVNNLPGVGQNLQDHLDIIITSFLKKGDIASLHHSVLLKQLNHCWKYYKGDIENSFVSSNVGECGAIYTINPESPAPDTQIHFAPGIVENHALQLVYGKGVTAHSCFLRPYSRGNVGLKDNNPLSNPKIQMNYLSDKRDLDYMIKGAKMTYKILKSGYFKDQSVRYKFVNDNFTDSQWEDFIRRESQTIYHPVGSCKMGNDGMSVVNEELKVHGINKLRVADASIMPNIVSGNTNAPTMMIAQKCAEFIVKEHKL